MSSQFAYNQKADLVAMFHGVFLFGWVIYFLCMGVVFLVLHHWMAGAVMTAGGIVGFIVGVGATQEFFDGNCPLSLLEDKLRLYAQSSGASQSFWRGLFNGEFGLPRDRILWTAVLWSGMFLIVHALFFLDTFFV